MEAAEEAPQEEAKQEQWDQEQEGETEREHHIEDAGGGCEACLTR